MRPLETHVEISSHLWMFNRVKELLSREGMLKATASDDEVRAAMMQWMDMMVAADRKSAQPTH